MMKSCVIHAHHAGLFSLLNNVITCMDLYDHVHVDWGENCIYWNEGDGNVWNSLFGPTQAPPGHFEVLDGYPDQWMTYKGPHGLYGLHDWRVYAHEHWQKITVRPEIMQKVQEYLGYLPTREFISVLVRSTPHAGEQFSGKSQSLDDYAKAIEENLPPKSFVFMMCPDYQTAAWFRQRFPVIWHQNTKRASNRDIDRHLVENQTIEDAKQVLIETLILSQATTLIHPISNIATAALYMNPNLRSVYLP